MRTVALALLLIAPVAAPQAAEPIQKAHVEGRVVTSTGEAVSKASVTLAGRGLPAVQPTVTDSEGKFVFEDLTPGKYTNLVVEKVGFVTQRYGARTSSASGTTLNLTPGMDLKDIVVRLTQQGTVVGHVTDPDGDPVASATIQVHGYSYVRARRQLYSSNGATTDDRGDFRIANLAPGRYFISAEERRVTPTSQSSATARDVNVATYYPNGLDASEGESVEVAEG